MPKRQREEVMKQDEQERKQESSLTSSLQVGGNDTHKQTHAQGGKLIGWSQINGGRERRDERRVFEEVFCTQPPLSSLLPALLCSEEGFALSSLA